MASPCGTGRKKFKHFKVHFQKSFLFGLYSISYSDIQFQNQSKHFHVIWRELFKIEETDEKWPKEAIKSQLKKKSEQNKTSPTS